MARQQFGPLMGVRAGADLSTTGQYLFVAIVADQDADDLSSDNEPFVTVASADGQDVLGVLQDKPKNGETATVQTYDTAKVVAGAAVNVGDQVQTNSSGQAITAATSTHRVLGIALETSAGAGEIIAVRLSQAHWPLA